MPPEMENKRPFSAADLGGPRKTKRLLEHVGHEVTRANSLALVGIGASM